MWTGKPYIYINPDKINNEILALRRYLQHTDVLCHTKFVRNWTGFPNYNNNAREKFDQLTETEELLKQITGNQAVTEKWKLRKRGVLNFMGGLSKNCLG
jgi:hypothetical protein